MPPMDRFSSYLASWPSTEIPNLRHCKQPIVSKKIISIIESLPATERHLGTPGGKYHFYHKARSRLITFAHTNRPLAATNKTTTWEQSVTLNC